MTPSGWAASGPRRRAAAALPPGEGPWSGDPVGVMTEQMLAVSETPGKSRSAAATMAAWPASVWIRMYAAIT